VIFVFKVRSILNLFALFNGITCFSLTQKNKGKNEA